MNKRVDREKYLEEFRSEIAGLNKSVKDLSADNARLNRKIEAHNVEIRSHREENACLKERLSKYEHPEPPKNFGNRSVPPSKEGIGDEVKRRIRSLKEKNGKKPEGQPGHEGSTHLMSDNPDRIENIQPNYSRECGRDLSGIEGEEEYSEECVGFRISLVMRRIRFMKKTCTCDCSTVWSLLKRRIRYT